MNRKEADIFTVQMTLEQLQERDQMLTAQNEMLKVTGTLCCTYPRLGNKCLSCYFTFLFFFSFFKNNILLSSLQADKSNLQRKVAELDDMVKKFIGTQTTEPRNRHQMSSSLSRPKDNDHGKRQHHSEKSLPRWSSLRTDNLTR